MREAQDPRLPYVVPCAGKHFDSCKMVLIGEYNTFTPVHAAGILVRANNEPVHNASRNKIEMVDYLHMHLPAFISLAVQLGRDDGG